MMEETPESILALGLELILGKDDRIFNRNNKYQKKTFKTHYGKLPSLLKIVWKAILNDGWINNQMKRKPKIMHFLWAMNFLQQYRLENASCVHFHCDSNAFWISHWYFEKSKSHRVTFALAHALSVIVFTCFG